MRGFLLAIVFQAGLVDGSQPGAEQPALKWLRKGAVLRAPTGNDKELTIDQSNLITSYKQLAAIASFTGHMAKAARMLEAAKKIQIKAGAKVTIDISMLQAPSTFETRRIAGNPKLPLTQADSEDAMLQQKERDDDDKQLTDELSGVEGGDKKSAPVANVRQSLGLDDDDDMQGLISEEGTDV
jgi:hypothetical protein